ncbi:MAG: recombinase family protein [Bacilli bacterium]|nr:recombinase family protein [Bacilli bacterium]
MNKLNVMYIRCSSNLQDTEHQKQSILSYCKANNITIDKTYEDNAISAYRKDITARNGILDLLADAKSGKIDIVFIFESSRLSRNMYEGLNLVQELTLCNVKIYSIKDNNYINQSEIDSLLNAVKFFINNQESKNISARTKSALQLRKEQGIHLGGVPWGFKVVDKKLIVDNTIDIKEFFNDYIAYGTSYCCKKYECTNLTVLNRIKNKIYLPIIGNELFSLANKTIENRKIERSSIARTNKSNELYESLLYHSCDQKLYISYDYRLKNPLYYRCTKCKGKNINGLKSFVGNKINTILNEKVQEILFNLNEKELNKIYLSKCIKKQLVLELQIKELKLQLKQLEGEQTKIKKNLELLMLNDISIDTIENITNILNDKKLDIDSLSLELEEKENNLSNLLSIEKENKSLINNIISASKIYNTASIAQKKAILQLLIKKIVITSYDDIDIYLNI